MSTLLFPLKKSALLIGVSTALLSLLPAQAAEKWTFSGYLETYYLADGNNAGRNERPNFTYSHNRSNEFSVNLALLQANYNDDNVRASLGIGAGSYMNANYAAEPDTYKNLFEANVGVRLSSRHNLWLDVGVLPSHIGFESAIGQQNWTLTRSLMADNSPYFETGAKMTYTSEDGVWTLAAVAVNGWQRIQRQEGNDDISFGHQITYTPNEHFTLNSSSFIGSDTEDERERLFHNLFATWSITSQLAVTFAFDYGREEREVEENGHNEWWSSAMVGQYKLSEQLWLGARIEYYRDRGGVIVASPDGAEFATSAASVNLDYRIAQNVWWRNEWRYFNNDDAIFTNDDALTRTESIFTTALTFTFN